MVITAIFTVSHNVPIYNGSNTRAMFSNVNCISTVPYAPRCMKANANTNRRGIRKKINSHATVGSASNFPFFNLRSPRPLAPSLRIHYLQCSTVLLLQQFDMPLVILMFSHHVHKAFPYFQQTQCLQYGQDGILLKPTLQPNALLHFQGELLHSLPRFSQYYFHR
ncbi:hypothetical protein protein [Bacillus cereus G9241]|nr:hypothetical protein protein [Bacillus cereus G9241]